jgi:NAD(P)-dependent dehydrogenase (short-subunit alcohol dehydrogenase family)
VIGDIDSEGGEAVARDLRAAGQEALFVRTDVTRESEVAALYERAWQAFGRIDFCHNNAGGGPSGHHFEMSRETWDQGLALNLTSTFLCLKHQAPLMAQSGGGAIVNTASAAGQRVLPRSSIFYMAAKAGVIQLTKAAALHYADQKIRVNCIAPGLTGTALTRLSEDEVDRVLSRNLIKRAARSDDVADAVVWLCSDEAAMITGLTVNVDGGAHVT